MSEDGKREIACGHMNVCYKYMGLSEDQKGENRDVYNS